jgi:hypothetical protein
VNRREESGENLFIVYPNVGKDVLHFTFWGIIIVANVQLAKVFNSILGNGSKHAEGNAGEFSIASAQKFLSPMRPASRG